MKNGYARLGALSLLSLAAAGSAFAGISYHVVDLGVLNSGDLGSFGGSMNALNQSVGASIASDGSLNPFSADASGTMSALQPVGSSQAHGVNDGGLAVGTSEEGTSLSQAVMWVGGSAVTLPGITVNSQSSAVAVNNANLIAGTSTDANGDTNLVVWQNGAILHQATQSGATGFTVTGIDTAGDVVGYSSLGAFLWNSNSGFQTFGSTQAGAMGISSDGSTILGYDVPSGGTGLTPVTWNTAGTETVLPNIYTDAFGSLSSAVAVNSEGTIVGFDGFGDGEYWSGGQAYSVSGSLDAASTGWLIQETYSINSLGTIFAAGVNPNTGLSDALLLQAVPEPMSLAVLGIAGLALLRRRRSQ